MIQAVKELSVETFNSNSYDIWNSANRIPQCWSYNVKINFARHQHDTEETQNRAGSIQNEALLWPFFGWDVFKLFDSSHIIDNNETVFRIKSAKSS